MNPEYFEEQRRDMVAAVRAITDHMGAQVGKTALDERVLRAMAKVRERPCFRQGHQLLSLYVARLCRNQGANATRSPSRLRRNRDRVGHPA